MSIYFVTEKMSICKVTHLCPFAGRMAKSQIQIYLLTPYKTFVITKCLLNLTSVEMKVYLKATFENVVLDRIGKDQNPC